MNRNIQISDAQDNKISEEDLLIIDSAVLGDNSSFWRSNLGEFCKRQNVSQVRIQMKNCYPFLKVEYTLSFIPHHEEKTYNDVTFLKYLSDYAVNFSNKPSTDVDLSDCLLDIKNKQGQNVKVGEMFSLTKEMIDFPKFMKEDWIKKLEPKIHSIDVFTENEGFYLKTIHKYKHADGSYFNLKEASCLSEEEFERCSPDDKNFFLKEDAKSSWWYKNHGEEMLKIFLAMQK